MLPRLAADGVLLLHLAFIAFAVLGALLVIRWHWIVLLHLPAVAWAAIVEMTGRICPLTYVENHFRIAAGASGYAGSFVEHYLLRAIYPDGLTRHEQYALAVVVIALNAAIYGWIVRSARVR
jgi:hypothetical protein